MPITALDTSRLHLRPLTAGDAGFMLDLLNQPSFLRHIGDREARDEAGARAYIVDRVLAAYARHGFGMYAMQLRDESRTDVPQGDRGAGALVGICGLVKRDSLPDVDIGYALLERHWGRGYAREACEAVLAHAWSDLRLPRVVAITGPDNLASIALLGKIGMRFDRVLDLPEGESALFTAEPPASGA